MTAEGLKRLQGDNRLITVLLETEEKLSDASVHQE